MRRGCLAVTGSIVIVPKEDKSVQYKHRHHDVRAPFVIYADFECLTKPIDSALPDPKKSYTANYQHHVPCGFKFTVIDYKREVHKTRVYRGEDVVAMFNHYLNETADELVKIIKTVRPMIITEEQEREFQTATLC